MIPANSFTAVAQPSEFEAPYNILFRRYKHVCPGGIALGDASKGRDYQNWEVQFKPETSMLEVKPVGAASPQLTLPAPDLIYVSLAFDNNMAPVLAWLVPSGANLYYFDSVSSSYTTRFFSGFTSCRVCTDDVRDFNAPASDVIFGYTRNGNLYWRQQRDRYDIERLVGPTSNLLITLGQNTSKRLQFGMMPTIPTRL